ncbi:MAG: TnpV protein [Clostridia bacterium]|nr:TnpV protein [Clostridia bacterium]
MTENLKEENQMEWVQSMGNIETQTRQIVYRELRDLQVRTKTE